MRYQQAVKKVKVVSPQALINNAAVTCAIVDCYGADYAEFEVLLGATDIALTTLKLTESNDSGMSGATDVTGAVMGTSNNTTGSASTLPTSTDDNHYFTFYVDLRGRKRDIQPAISVGNGSTGAYVTCTARLGLLSDGPSVAADRGNTQDFIL